MALPILPTLLGELREKRQGNGDSNTINRSRTSQSDGNGDFSKYGNSHGLSQSDKIASGIGVGVGVVAIIGVILACLHIKHSKAKREQRRQWDIDISDTWTPAAIAALWVFVAWTVELLCMVGWAASSVGQPGGKRESHRNARQMSCPPSSLAHPDVEIRGRLRCGS